MTDSTAQAAGPQMTAEEELTRRLDDAWGARGEYADDDLDVLRALCGEAAVAVRHLAALSSSPATQPEPVAYLIEVEGGRERYLMFQKPFNLHRYARTVTPLYEAVPTPQADGRPSYEELTAFVSDLPDLRHWAAECLNSGRQQSYEDLMALAERWSSLLSRIPKGEP